MFPSSQYDGAFSSSQSTDSLPSNPTKVWGAQGLMPVTVKQLSDAHHSGDNKSGFSIDGVEVTNVTLLGRVSEKTARVTDVSFSLDDGTGRVDCRRWVNEAADSREMEEVYDGMYVRVVGHLRSPQGRRQIVAFSVRPVVNFDEVSFHFIDCIHQHLQKSKLKTGATSSPHKVEPSKNLPPSNITNGNTITSAPSNELMFQLSGNYTIDGLKGTDQKVLEFLQQNYAQEKGVHRDEISRQLKIPADKIMDSIRTLEEEGLIYSTIDEYHYKSTTEA